MLPTALGFPEVMNECFFFFFFFFNWDSLHYKKVWSYKSKKHKKIKAYLQEICLEKTYSRVKDLLILET